MLPLKDKIVKDIADDLEIEESLCDNVVSWVYEDTYKATRTNNSIELAGFGVLRVSQTKLKRRLIRCEKIKAGTLAKIEEGNSLANWTKRAQGIDELIEFLKGYEL